MYLKNDASNIILQSKNKLIIHSTQINSWNNTNKRF